MSPTTRAAAPEKDARHVLDFDYGVRAYPGSAPGGYWRLRWMEANRRRETTAATRDDAPAKAADLVARLGQGRPTDWAQAKGDALVAHYLDPTRRPARGRAWSARHREEQQAYCDRFVTPVIAGVELRRLSRVHFERILVQAPTASVAAHLRRCCSGHGGRRAGGGSPPGPPGRAAGAALVTAGGGVPRSRGP